MKIAIKCVNDDVIANGAKRFYLGERTLNIVFDDYTDSYPIRNVISYRILPPDFDDDNVSDEVM